MLVITPRARAGDSGAGFRLRLLPCVAPGAFPAPRLAPRRNNLRSAVGAAGAASAPELLPTPHYNAAILRVGARAAEACLRPMQALGPRTAGPPRRSAAARRAGHAAACAARRAGPGGGAAAGVPRRAAAAQGAPGRSHAPRARSARGRRRPLARPAARALRGAARGEQVWARVQGTEHEPDGFNGALLSLLAAHLVDSGALVRARRGRGAWLHAGRPPGAGDRSRSGRRRGAARWRPCPARTLLLQDACVLCPRASLNSIGALAPASEICICSAPPRRRAPAPRRCQA